jgi:hypothetical protein
MVEATNNAKDAVVKWGCGECFLMETEKNLGLPVTGVTAFPRYGAQFITDKNLYIRCDNDKLSLEDHIINHVLAYNSSYILPLLIVWKINESKINTKILREKSSMYKVSEIIDSIVIYMETNGLKRGECMMNMLRDG